MVEKDVVVDYFYPELAGEAVTFLGELDNLVQR